MKLELDQAIKESAILYGRGPIKLKEKLAKEYANEVSYPHSPVADLVERDFLAGFEKAREMASKKILRSVNIDGIDSPHDAIMNCHLQSRHDSELCLNLGEEEVE